MLGSYCKVVEKGLEGIAEVNAVVHNRHIRFCLSMHKNGKALLLSDLGPSCLNLTTARILRIHLLFQQKFIVRSPLLQIDLLAIDKV